MGRKACFCAALAAALIHSSSSSATAASCYHFVPLGDLPGGLTLSRAFGISEQGVVAGRSSSANVYEAFLLDPATGPMTGLDDLPGGIFQSVAYAINGKG